MECQTLHPQRGCSGVANGLTRWASVNPQYSNTPLRRDAGRREQTDAIDFVKTPRSPFRTKDPLFFSITVFNTNIQRLLLPENCTETWTC